MYYMHLYFIRSLHTSDIILHFFESHKAQLFVISQIPNTDDGVRPIVERHQSKISHSLSQTYTLLSKISAKSISRLVRHTNLLSSLLFIPLPSQIVTMTQLSRAEETHFLQATIARMEAEVLRIRNKQALLSARLNELRSASSSLPPEILVVIFSEFCAEFRSPKMLENRYHYLQVICQVCSRWRRLVMATPSLWTYFVVEVPDRDWATTASLKLLRLHYSNASTMPLDITLRLGPGWSTPGVPYATQGFYTPVRDLIYLIFDRASARLGSFTVERGSYIPWQWISIISSFTTSVSNDIPISYPSLTSLNLGISNPWNGVDVLGRQLKLFYGTATVPSLRRWTSYHGFVLHVPLDNLTIVRFEQITPKQCLDILTQYPRLVEFHAAFLSEPPEGTEPPASECPVVILPALQSLTWCFGYHDWDMHFLTHFQLPALSTFYRIRDPRSRAFHDDVDDYLTADHLDQWKRFLVSQPKLRHLGLELNEGASEGLWRAPYAFDELHVWGGFIWGADDNDPTSTRNAFFNQLILDSASQDWNDRVPRVREIYLYEGWSNLLPHRVDVLLSGIESRWNPPEGWPRLECLALCKTSGWAHRTFSEGWSVEQLDRLQKLIREGFKLVIKPEVKE
ncbi:hypothetical protein AN958_05657 [Leucoagaricus sp. SymC.cos]|nr:hypothetical protein AN958_05657 [Leucoagaricus sp. SymC.cos]